MIQPCQILSMTEVLLDSVFGSLVEQMETGIQMSMCMHACTCRLWVHTLKTVIEQGKSQIHPGETWGCRTERLFDCKDEQECLNTACFPPLLSLARLLHPFSASAWSTWDFRSEPASRSTPGCWRVLGQVHRRKPVHLGLHQADSPE